MPKPTQQTNEGSILDRVMSRQQESLAQSLNPYEIVIKLANTLNPREREVVTLRFGLDKDGEPMTLDAIGKKYKITRERVRQIEAAAVRKLRQVKDAEGVLGPLSVVSQRTLEKHGGVMPEDMFLERLLGEQVKSTEQRAAALMLLDKLVDEVERIKHDIELHPTWKLSGMSWDFFRSTLAALHTVVEKLNEPKPIEHVLSSAKEHPHIAKHQDKLSDEALESFLRTSRKVRRNAYGEWGMTDWHTVTPRRMNDKIYMVLKRHGKPMHFTDIAKAINDAGFDHKIAYPATVHNELILDKKYVLVGRGVYALREWGFRPGVVADVIEWVLREAKEPFSKEQIIEGVMKQRFVKPSTVSLALMNRKRFTKLPGGRYGVVER